MEISGQIWRSYEWGIPCNMDEHEPPTPHASTQEQLCCRGLEDGIDRRLHPMGSHGRFLHMLHEFTILVAVM
jgi:hypothetical protein